MKHMKVTISVVLTALLCAGGAIAQQKFVIKTLVEKKVAELPGGPLYWRIENFPTLAQAKSAASPMGLAAESAGKVWLFTLGPAGGSSEGGTKVAEVGPIPRFVAPQYLLRINEASGPPGSITSVHTHPGSEAFYVLAGEQTIRTPQGVLHVKAGQPETGRGADNPMQVSSTGSTDLHSLVMFVVDASRPFSSPAKIPSAEQGGLRPGELFHDRLKSGNYGPKMMVVPSGKFRMGDIQGIGGEDEQPVHDVHIRRSFAVSRNEITFEQYDEFAEATGRVLPEDEGFGRGRRPVIRVSWNDAVAYARWLSQQTSNHYRLPTEAEWEYAARAGTETTYWWGNDMKQGLANCVGCGSPWDGKHTAPVGSFQPNPFGLCDTAGNVLEWVQDCWHESYNGAPADGAAWEHENGGDCARRGFRGGQWRTASIRMRSSFRVWNRPNVRLRGVGFRLVREIEPDDH